MKKCYECRSSNIVDGYKETNITNIKYQIRYFCQECLTKYAKTMETSDHTARLRDTKIDDYNSVVNDFSFIPYSDKQKISYVRT